MGVDACGSKRLVLTARRNKMTLAWVSFGDPNFRIWVFCLGEMDIFKKCTVSTESPQKKNVHFA